MMIVWWSKTYDDENIWMRLGMNMQCRGINWKVVSQLTCLGKFGSQIMLRRVGWFGKNLKVDFQIFSKSPHPPKHNLGAKFSKARQLRDDFSINTPTLHVHAQSHSDIFIVISFRSSYDHHKNCHILPTLSYSWEGSEKRKGSGIFWTKSEDLVQLPTALLQIETEGEQAAVFFEPSNFKLISN